MSKSKQKGTTWESAVVAFLNENGIRCERRALVGNNDKGDILIYSSPGTVLECKAEKQFDLASYIKEVDVEVVNAGGEFGAAIVKAPRKPVSKAYVVISLELFVKILRKLIS